MLKRLFDVVVAGAGLLAAAPLLAAVALIVRAGSQGPALHWSRRVGRGNRIFLMPKFRTMRTDAPDLPTHLLTDPDRWVTPVGRVLRRTSLDELPQLWSVLTGDMSLVGPRPALFSQDDLIALRTKTGAHRLRPGITGWAQVNGRDELPVAEKAALDAEYVRRMSLAFDLRILAVTALQALRREGVAH